MSLSRKELVELAEHYPHIHSANALLVALKEAIGEQKYSLAAMVACVDLARMCIIDRNYQCVDDSLTVHAIRYEKASAQIQTLLATLAVVLQSAGVECEY